MSKSWVVPLKGVGLPSLPLCPLPIGWSSGIQERTTPQGRQTHNLEEAEAAADCVKQSYRAHSVFHEAEM